MIAYAVQPNLVGAILAGEITAVVWPNGPFPHARVGDDIRLCLGLRGPETITLLIAPCTASEEIARTDAVRSRLVGAGAALVPAADRAAAPNVDIGPADGGLRAWWAARQTGGLPHRADHPHRGFTRISWDFARARHVASAVAFEGVDETTLSRGLQ
ncbi:hypothetical protein [Albibacillus kandeliae]|uniref:hypothetical protein n=1 Tax=Albibacillus kandeliae TaxID=2174228 RepID=UPI000D69A55B|nr:hypothetical protein [Albibacillus kandeliae]